MNGTVDVDQLRALRALRYWLRPDQVEVIEVREGVEGEGQPSPRLASQQLAVSIPDQQRRTDPPSRLAKP